MSIFESLDGSVSVVDTNEWVAANRKDFEPPVCNKCMFADQLKVFFVKGPNSRKDFHLEEGEEIFFQIKGNMVLKVVEKGTRKDIEIREGEIFVLPAFVEHSPQRPDGTLGCVVERERSRDELDCIRYFVDESDHPEVLWERWFHLSDVVKDLPPVIREFNESSEKTNGKPGVGSFKRKPPFEPKPVTLLAPLDLTDYIDKNLEQINQTPQKLFCDQGTRAVLTLHGNGSHELDSDANELVLLFQRGNGVLIHGAKRTEIAPFFTTRVKPRTKITLKINEGVCLVASISPK